MKYLILVLFISLLSGCGPVEEDEQEEGAIQIGQVRAFKADDKYTDEEVVIASKICEALENKEMYFNSVIVNRGIELSYDLDVTKCGATSAQKSSFSSVVASSGSSLSLSTNTLGAFKNIVTPSSKVVSDICKGIKSKNRYYGNKSIMSWYFLVDKSSSQCKGENNYCLFVETGFSSDGKDYKTQAIEAYNITNSSSEIIGLVTARAFQTAQGCTGSDTYLKEQVFKGTL